MAASNRHLVAGWLNGRSWVAGDLLFQPLQERDIEPIRHWRNEQIPVLRQEAVLTPEQQRGWFTDCVLPTHASADPDFLLVSIRDGNQLVGYGGLTHIAWPSARAELSILLSTGRAQNPSEFEALTSNYLSWVIKVGFEELQLHRLFTETYSFRHDQIRVLEDHGFELEGRLRDHVHKGGRYVDALIHGLLNRDGGTDAT